MQRATACVCPVLILTGFFVYFLFQGAGLEPIVFIDEWQHSVSARLIPIADAYSPSFAFYALYRITNSCGDEFLDCARLLNILLFLGSAVLFYRLSLRHVDRRYALILLVVYLAVPSNILLFLFTPDAMHYALFAVFLAAVVSLEGVPAALVGGALLGVMAIVKTNATLVLAGLIFFFLVEAWFQHKSWRRFITLSALAVGAFFVSRTLLAVALAGKKGLSFTGGHYSGYLSHALDLPWLLERLPLILFAAFGHLMTVAIVLGMFIACMALSSGAAPLEPRERRLSVAVATLLAPVLAITIIFSAVAVDAGPYESIQRLSVRYYSFLFPFGYLYALARLTHLPSVSSWSARDALPPIVMLILSGASLVLMPRFFTPIINESPELWLLTSSSLGRVIVSLACLLPLAVLVLRPAFATRAYAAALLVVSGTWLVASSHGLRYHKSPSPFDAAGRHAALFLGEQRRDIAIVGNDMAQLYRAAFHINALGPDVVQINGVPDDPAWSHIRSKPWTLLIGADALRLAPAGTAAPSGFALVPTSLLARP